ncbi:DivIVA domain-containing protein [Rhodococcus sp. KRD162]|uniref:DivIVA domain-containing protein n=1 Tax=Rhodococcus sp. KRD162 TaxID=2729725 RepID=UPI0019D21DBA|nr:DivIVA domain-containing protein [Rhodococcus sp. KRD162]
MLTLLIYVVVIAVVAAALFFVASTVFGRGEELGPLPEGTTATVLPAEAVTGADVRSLKFQQTLRGYKPSEVDWALERLGGEIDVLRSRLSALQQSGAQSGSQLGTTSDGRHSVTAEPDEQ